MYETHKETRKVQTIQRKTEAITVFFPSKSQILHLLHKDHKSSVLNTLKEHKKIIEQKLKETRRMISQQNINKNTYILKGNK